MRAGPFAWIATAFIAGSVPALAWGADGTPFGRTPVAGQAVADPAAVDALVGEEAWERIVGNTIEGTTPDGPYTEYFKPDGTVRHHDRDGLDDGRWTLHGAMVCLAFPGDDGEECRSVEIAGSSGSFLDTDGQRYPFTILPGNAKKL